MSEFEILITSPGDRENLVAEIWYNNNLIAEINQETENQEIELYVQETTALPLNEFLNILEAAKRKLKD